MTTAPRAVPAPLPHRAVRKDARDLELLRDGFGKHSERLRSQRAFEWQYFENTTVQLFVDLGVRRDETKLAAVYAIRNASGTVSPAHGDARFHVPASSFRRPLRRRSVTSTSSASIALLAQ